ncbi:MAG: hypothetical protein LIO87_00830 [Eubacterium sp.]|nr:hypothetical protein [Eubacterium sp.]
MFLALYRYVDLKTKETVGSIPSQSNYEAYVEYAKKIFEAESIDEVTEMQSTLLASVSNYFELIEKEYLKHTIGFV